MITKFYTKNYIFSFLLLFCLIFPGNSEVYIAEISWNKIDKVRRFLEEEVVRSLQNGRLERDNDFIYAVDIGQLLMYFAQKKDKDIYEQLKIIALENFVINNDEDPYTKYFVAWRYQKNRTLDASGTTEALRIAKGLWLGSKAFKNKKDQEMAIQILKGYVRHAYIDQGIWLIRNYFNMQTRSFANNSFLVDYDPDFIYEVGIHEPEFKNIANKSYDVVAKSVAPCGLLYDIIQPEIKTLVPEAHIYAFSPNDIIQLSNSFTVAETITKGDPQTSRGVLFFALKYFHDLGKYHYGVSGKKYSWYPINNMGQTSLVRLCAKLNNEEATKYFLNRVLPFWEVFTYNLSEPRMYIASEILLTIQACEKYR